MPVLRLKLSNLRATQRLGALLAGDLRAIIQVANPDEMDVPSPSFTLVQTYELPDGTPLWHLDLYRIEGPEEAMELGLEDAFIDAACLIEWPDR